MLKNEPVHGLWCSAALKKTACRFCEKSVYLFFCDCGCMVMLEESSRSWAVHACRDGLNRFSGRDAFSISRALGKKIDTACLAAASADAKQVRAVIENGSAMAQNMVRGDVARVRASFCFENI